MNTKYSINYQSDLEMAMQQNYLPAPNLNEDVLPILKDEKSEWNVESEARCSISYSDGNGNLVEINQQEGCNSSQYTFRATLKSSTRESLEKLAYHLGFPFDDKRVVEDN